MKLRIITDDSTPLIVMCLSGHSARPSLSTSNDERSDKHAMNAHATVFGKEFDVNLYIMITEMKNRTRTYIKKIDIT